VSPTRQRYYRAIFLTTAVYDLVLGVVFTFFAGWAFGLVGIGDDLPPSAYVPLIGAFLFVIGIAYLLIFLGDLERNRDLIAVGTLYKAAYTGIAFYYWAIGDYPHILFCALFGIVDLVMFVAMAECWWYLYSRRNRGLEAPRTPA
jgi:hypothetical protein